MHKWRDGHHCFTTAYERQSALRRACAVLEAPYVCVSVSTSVRREKPANVIFISLPSFPSLFRFRMASSRIDISSFDTVSHRFTTSLEQAKIWNISFVVYYSPKGKWAGDHSVILPSLKPDGRSISRDPGNWRWYAHPSMRIDIHGSVHWRPWKLNEKMNHTFNERD